MSNKDNGIEITPVKYESDPGDGESLVLLSLKDADANINIDMWALRAPYEEDNSNIIYHRTDRHALFTHQNGQHQYWRQGQRFREDGPAVFDPNGIMTAYFIENHFIPRAIVEETGNSLGIDLLGTQNPFGTGDDTMAAVARLHMLDLLSKQNK